MDGQKKSEHMMDRIRDLALGEIHPQDELALLAHVAECEACRDAYNEAGALRSFVDRGMEKLVGGLRESEPSPQFAVRLRARLAAEPAPGRWNLNALQMWDSATRRPLYYVAGTAAVALLIAFAMNSWMHRERSTPPAPIEPLTAQIPASSTPPSSTPPSSAVPTTAPSNAGTSVPQPAANSELPRAASPEHARARLASRTPESRALESHATDSRPADSRPASRNPEVLVPKDQMRAVAQLYQAAQSGRVDAEQLYIAQQKTREPVEVKPIEITPLESAADSEEDSAEGPGLP